MDIESLHLLVEVARAGSFAAVARTRDLDPSLVSRAVAGIERRLGLRVFQRTTRRLSLTEAGEAYVRRLGPLLQELDQARDDAQAVRAGPVGTLRLTASVSFGQRCLVPLLAEFRRLLPQLTLELLLTDANLDLVAERIDLALRLGPPPAGDLIGVKLFDTRYRVCASPSYPRLAEIAAPADLRQHDCLLFLLPVFRSRWLFRDDGGVVAEVPVRGDVVISNALALRECAIAGIGPALLATWLIDDDLAQGRLVDLFPAHEITATDFATAAWLLYPSRRYLPRKVVLTIDLLRRRLRPRAAAPAAALPGFRPDSAR
jgi:DNA-binding transcriptional LysR family regulator